MSDAAKSRRMNLSIRNSPVFQQLHTTGVSKSLKICAVGEKAFFFFPLLLTTN